ncbi:MAG: bifunctional adenosylcobinamide kinase/adenosylcobinamide-phosphate guanylyltransferase [Pseudoflavonifractor sp.]
MLILVSGGSGSGKSAFAEGLIAACPAAPRIYIATMQIWDEECRQRVRRHRAMRADKGFCTYECPRDLETLQVPAGSAVLLEDLSNLTANECFGGSAQGAEGRILAGVSALQKTADLTVIVTNELFSDGLTYDAETGAYLSMLAGLNCAIAAKADRVYEVVCGIPVCHKGEEK